MLLIRSAPWLLRKTDMKSNPFIDDMGCLAQYERQFMRRSLQLAVSGCVVAPIASTPMEL
jgi:hypothetical protein